MDNNIKKFIIFCLVIAFLIIGILIVRHSNNMLSEEIEQKHITVFKILTSSQLDLFITYSSDDFNETAEEIIQLGYYSELKTQRNLKLLGLIIIIFSSLFLLFVIIDWVY
jgi:hypothetical protein